MKQISELCVHVYVREDLKVLLQLLPAYELRDLNVATQSLEDIFLQYYGEKGVSYGVEIGMEAAADFHFDSSDVFQHYANDV